MKFDDVTGAVICGGQSKRFGSDKRLFKYEGRTLLDISFQKLNQICHKTVCVFRGIPPDSLRSYPHITDELDIEGPMAGVLSALKYSATPYVFILPCDVPKVTSDFIINLVALRAEDKIVIPYSDRLEPLIGIYPKHVYSKLKHFSHTTSPSLKNVLMRMGHKEVTVVKTDADLENFNIPRLS